MVALVVSFAAIVLVTMWLYSNTVKNQQIADMLARIETLEQAAQTLQIRSDSIPTDNLTNISGIKEDIVGTNDLAKIAKRLDYLESLLTELIESSSVKRQDIKEVATNRNVPIYQTAEQHQERLELLENTIKIMQNQFDAISQSISPVVDLGSPEAELIRAYRYYEELKEPSTAVQAYTSLLKRYELTYDETLMVLTNSTSAYDRAAQRQPSFVADNISQLLLLEERISLLPQKEQGELFSRLANACMHGRSYEDAHRLYQKAIQMLPDGEDKVSAYWSMSFAARQAVGEEAFFETLRQGHKLGSDLGIDVSSFEKEIAEPREKN